MSALGGCPDHPGGALGCDRCIDADRIRGNDEVWRPIDYNTYADMRRMEPVAREVAERELNRVVKPDTYLQLNVEACAKYNVLAEIVEPILQQLRNHPTHARELGLLPERDANRIRAIVDAFLREAQGAWATLTIHGRDGQHRVLVDGREIIPFQEDDMEFRGFFEKKFTKLKPEEDAHLLAAIGGMFEGDEVWVSELRDPDEERPQGDEDYNVLVYNEDDHRQECGPRCKTSRMYSIKNGERRQVVEWRWLKPVVKAGKIQGFEPVL